ncbi:MAG: mannose-6-phosphate isomerase [Dysgonamonadaceae bacterium]|jgi:mannose-6-phosphate isomerase|nr:mannose-6-phosphate isomerase [Dysgonamonadaceae bacterium]
MAETVPAGKNRRCIEKSINHKNKITVYPLKFEPLLKSVLWGGDAICPFKNIHPQQSGIGESWEISGVPGDVSIVSNGDLKGKSLAELLETGGERLVGKPVFERFGTTFPLLIKFIDARQALSIQVHPDDALAGKRHHSFGKTEMWYVVKAAKDAFLYSGFQKEMDAETYVQSLKDDSFMQYLQRHTVRAGDVFFLPAGRVHAIGAGCFIAEIQQTSNITYRIYDYNRTDANGNPRELHTELAKDAIDYRVYPNYKTDYASSGENRELVRCPYFTTYLIEGKKGTLLHRQHRDTFVIYICLSGKLKLTDAGNHSIELRQGETVLVPAETGGRIALQPEEDCRLLETYIS